MKELSIALIVSVVSVACSHPVQPALGAVVDRMGRAAINTAVSDPFDQVAGKTTNQAKDDFNASTDVSAWGTQFGAQFRASLAVLDGLDRTCGNQLIAKPLVSGAVPTDRYAPLAGVLADDQLYLNTASATCGLYLAVEADATGLAPGNGDCGGRTPTEDVVDESYSLLALGAPSGVTDNVSSDADGAPSNTDFPFLTAANQP